MCEVMVLGVIKMSLVVVLYVVVLMVFDFCLKLVF